MAGIDYTDPLSYVVPVFQQRARVLESLRKDPSAVQAFRTHYAEKPWRFVTDWGVTYDPRNPERGLPAVLPFVLWPKQIELMQWMDERWRKSERGLVEKSRDWGVTWIAVGYTVARWLFVPGFAAGFGSSKEDKVDRQGDPDSIFEKIRFMVDYIPDVFMPAGFKPRLHSTYMRLVNPENGSSIIGEAGAEIGRGGRKSIYVVDEDAFIENQQRVDNALANATNCQIDVSTYNGPGNLFYRKSMKFHGTPQKFVCDWHDDPRKDQAWYDKYCANHDPVTVAQEVDRNPNASDDDSFLPAAWVNACVDAHVKLGFDGTGAKVVGFDPADTGDAKACACRHGSIIKAVHQRKRGDIRDAVPWAYEIADDFRAGILSYDGDGMGDPVMKVALEVRAAKTFEVVVYRGSEGVKNPLATYGNTNVKNKDYFQNYRAQSWTLVRDRMRNTYLAIERAKAGQIVNVDPEKLLSISSSCEDILDIKAELSMPRRQRSVNGKIKVESKDDMKKRGIKSPNLAESIVVALSVDAIDITKQQPITQRARFSAGAYVQSLDSGMGY
jgi:hypothetical protein